MSILKKYEPSEIELEYSDGYYGEKNTFTPEEMIEMGIKTDLELIHEIDPNIKIPKNYVISKEGIFEKYVRGEEKLITKLSKIVIIPSSLIKYEDEDTIDVELAYLINGNWQTTYVERRTLLDRTRVMDLSSLGVSIGSRNSDDFNVYFKDMLSLNHNTLKVKTTTNKIGWVQNHSGYVPIRNNDIEININKGFKNMIEGYVSKGTIEGWKEEIRPYYSNKYFRFILSAGFTGPLIDLVKCRNPIISIWYGSRAGKTATIQAVNSIYGNPSLLEKTWNGTLVGIEQLLSYTTNDNVLTLDEAGMAQKKIDEFIFMIASR